MLKINFLEYWDVIVGHDKIFYSDTVNHTTGKMISYINAHRTTRKERADFMLFCSNKLKNSGKFNGSKVASNLLIGNKIPLLFYSYTQNKEDLKNELKFIFSNLNDTPYKNWLEEKKITNYFQWKLDTKTVEEIKNKTHWTYRQNIRKI